ncbi:Hypothetical protein D9617_65g035130 [Elsinoe fawcettii]|nr:Hypothetical protein D9617_65g035130 [Elsinoe fawcettii]
MLSFDNKNQKLKKAAQSVEEASKLHSFSGCGIVFRGADAAAYEEGIIGEQNSLFKRTNNGQVTIAGLYVGVVV